MKIFNTILLFTVLLSTISCSKDDDAGASTTKEALKVTVTSSSAFTNNGSDIRVSVNSADTKGNPMKWVVNGENGIDGQLLYSVNKEYFYGGKTTILQSQSNYLTASINIAAFSITTPFTLTYKVEQGSKVVVEKTETINPDATPLTVNLNY